MIAPAEASALERSFSGLLIGAGAGLWFFRSVRAQILLSAGVVGGLVWAPAMSMPWTVAAAMAAVLPVVLAAGPSIGRRALLSGGLAGGLTLSVLIGASLAWGDGGDGRGLLVAPALAALALASALLVANNKEPDPHREETS